MIGTVQNAGTNVGGVVVDPNKASLNALNESGSDEVNSDLIFREIAKSFEYILKYYDIHKSQIEAYKL